MKFYLQYTLLICIIACSQPKAIQVSSSEAISAKSVRVINLPIWIDYSKSVPDSVQDFLKIYFQSQKINVIGMKAAIEQMMDQSNKIIMNKVQSGSVLSEREVKALVEKSMKEPICSKLSINLYAKEKIGELVIDSVKWNVIPVPSLDTAKKIISYAYYPSLKLNKNIYIEWRSFVDTVLASGLLK